MCEYAGFMRPVSAARGAHAVCVFGEAARRVGQSPGHALHPLLTAEPWLTACYQVLEPQMQSPAAVCVYDGPFGVVTWWRGLQVPPCACRGSKSAWPDSRDACAAASCPPELFAEPGCPQSHALGTRGSRGAVGHPSGAAVLPLWGLREWRAPRLVLMGFFFRLFLD